MQDWEATPETQAGHVAIVDPDVVTDGTATHITVACGLIAPIHVENGMVSRALEGQRIEQLPLNGRSLTTLISHGTSGVEGCEPVDFNTTPSMSYRTSP
jgi:hypothetical protein